MKVALHFAIGPGPQEIDAEVAVIRSLIDIPAHRRHFRIYLGLILANLASREALDRLAVDVAQGATLASIDATGLRELLRRQPFFAVVVDGLTSRQATVLDDVMSDCPVYKGLLALDDRRAKQWVLYQLPAAFRIVGNELRIQHSFEALEGDPEAWTGRVNEWSARQLFETVTLEDTGVQATIFDEYGAPEHAQRRAETASLLEDQLSAVSNVVLLRLFDLDPRLVEIVHAALTAFETAETAEQRAQVAISLRRLLQRFANAVFPPTDETREGRKLGQAEYRNRLWAYVEDHSSGSRRAATLSGLDDVGTRIERLDSLTNAGLHDEIEPMALQRLLIAIIGLLYDLLLLAPPPARVPLTPYAEGIAKSLREMLEPDSE